MTDWSSKHEGQTQGRLLMSKDNKNRGEKKAHSP